MKQDKIKVPWPVNPLVAHIRIEAADIFQAVRQDSGEDSGVSLSLFDLAIQVMLVSCSYDPAYIWRGSPQYIAEVARLLRLNATHEAAELMDDLVQSGEVRLNVRAIKRIAEQQAERLVELRRQAHTDIGLPLYEDFSGFKEDDELTDLHLLSLGGQKGVYAEATERRSGSKVSLRQIEATVSQAYAKSMHYLHTPRDDEVIAFGAFRNSEQYPFAWVTYSRAGRKYKQHILQSLGMDHDATFELTRAWNCEDSPKNTMSILYAFGHAVLQERYLRAVDTTGAVITTVNPNLGFIGSAFRAVGFSAVAEKPTCYHYAENGAGSRYYITKRSAETGWYESVVEHNPKFPLLASKELVVLLVGTKRLPAAGPVIAVGLDEYGAG